MRAYLIQGGHRLTGVVRVHGAKNSVLPILAACVCGGGVFEIRNCPRIRDVETSVAILRALGCRTARQGGTLFVDSRHLDRCAVPEALMRGMRSSVLFLGALLTRCGRAQLAEPGGCRLGKRPIDLHLWAMEQLGADCIDEDGRITCAARNPAGCVLNLRCPSVGATENAMLAAVGCPGTTVIRGAAQEPEIADLARFLRAMGATLTGEGTDEITLEGGAPLHSAAFTVMPDRMEAATYLCAVAGCGGDVFLEGAQSRCLESVLAALSRAGCVVCQEADGLRITAPDRLQSPGEIITAPYPGFPTDAQAPLMAAVLRARGETWFTETIFENRMRHVEQLQRLGADIWVEGCRARVRGVNALRGANLHATDLRCGAALLVAALQARGESTVLGEEYISRGYEDLPGALRQMGAQVRLENC